MLDELLSTVRSKSDSDSVENDGLEKSDLSPPQLNGSPREDAATEIKVASPPLQPITSTPTSPLVEQSPEVGQAQASPSPLVAPSSEIVPVQPQTPPVAPQSPVAQAALQQSPVHLNVLPASVSVSPLKPSTSLVKASPTTISPTQFNFSFPVGCKVSHIPLPILLY